LIERIRPVGDWANYAARLGGVLYCALRHYARLTVSGVGELEIDWEFKTPDIPQCIQKISHEQYKNIFSYDLGNKNLWRTETLFGDWCGEYLLIAKDFYPASYIDDAIAAHESNPYRHNPKAPTNRNLEDTLRHYNQIKCGSPNLNCNFLYASACFLLRNDGKKSGDLPDECEVLKRSAPVLAFTIENMPKLKRVIAMGRVPRPGVR